MCSECSRAAYDADKIVRPCNGQHRFIWDSKREFRFCESCFIEEVPTMATDNKELMAVLGTINGQITDALGRDALDVLLEGAERMQKRKELHEDIAKYKEDAADAEHDMWESMSRMRRAKGHLNEALRQLQALGAKP